METFHETSMDVYFIRHGQTDYSLKDQKIYQGFGVNLAPLSEEGIRQIEEAAKDSRLKGAEIDSDLALYKGGSDGGNSFQTVGSADCRRDRPA